jgi:gliding motility-associated-like protein
MSCNNCLSPQISPLENTTYILHGIDSIGCKNSDSVIVNLKGSLFVPNTFTPNNDGANDFFEVKGEFVKDYKIWVFNRWGELVYHSSKITESWDGFFKNTASETGGYIWEIEFSDFSNEKKVIKGHLNLIR